MTGNMTQQTDADVTAFLEAVDHPVRRADGIALDGFFRRITGWTPRMWGASLVGYGCYHYVYDSGREGDMLATGFSPRKAALSIYVMPGYQEMAEMLSRLGKHKMGKACLDVTKLADIDMDVLEEIVRRGLADLGARYPVAPS